MKTREEKKKIKDTKKTENVQEQEFKNSKLKFKLAETGGGSRH